MKRETMLHLLLLFSLAALLGACVGQASPTAAPTATSVPAPSPTAAPPTATSTPANTATPTTAPTNTAAPTGTAVPTNTTAPTNTPTPTVPPPTATPTSVPTATPPPTPVPVRIAFAAGATSALVTGNLPARGAASYVLHAEANQLMEVDVSPLEGIQLAIYGADGTVIKGPGGTPFFRGYLPRTGDYILLLEAGAQPVSYTMSVIIPQRISFAPGATSAAVEGQLAAHGRDYYVLGIQANQVMEVDVSPEEGLLLIIYGVDGTVIKSGMGGGSFFRGQIPRTQDYILVLEAGDQPASYTMDVIIPQRISFAPGTTSAAVEGQLAAHARHYYVLGIQANQLLDVNVTPQQEVQLIIYGLDGTVLKSGMGNIASFRGPVPTTQDYILVLGAGDQPVSYAMNVMIPQRIQFAPGATSAVEQGNLGPHQQHAYILGALGGQTLQVTVTAPAENVNLVIYGVDGTVLKSGMGGGLTFEGALPSTQDYIVALTSGDQAVSYTLEVVIR
jgi:hypothetical protein